VDRVVFHQRLKQVQYHVLDTPAKCEQHYPSKKSCLVVVAQNGWINTKEEKGDLSLKNNWADICKAAGIDLAGVS